MRQMGEPSVTFREHRLLARRWHLCTPLRSPSGSRFERLEDRNLIPWMLFRSSHRRPISTQAIPGERVHRGFPPTTTRAAPTVSGVDLTFYAPGMADDLAGWEESGGAMRRRFEFADFSAAFAFMTRVALL